VLGFTPTLGQSGVATLITAPNKLFGVIVREMEANVFFEVIDTPLKINAPIGLTIIFATTN
jgi:hypothetical protein